MDQYADINKLIESINAGVASLGKESGINFQTLTPLSGGNSPKSTATVVTDANIRENVIPETINKANTLIGPGAGAANLGKDPIYDENGNQLAVWNNNKKAYIDSSTGKNYAPKKVEVDAVAELENDPIYKAELALLDSMKASNDAQTDMYIQAIRGKYNQRNRDLVESQKSSTNATQQALLLGGSARYAPVSSQGILTAKERYDMQTLSDLQAEEEALVMEATGARDAKNYQILGQRLEMLEAKRKEKLEFAKEINKSLAETTKKLREDQANASQEATIADLVAQGITDPAQILDFMNFNEDGTPTGGGVTLQKISDTLKLLTVGGINPGDVKSDFDQFQYFKKTGQLPSGVASLPENEQYFGFLNAMKLANSGKLGSSGVGGYFGSGDGAGLTVGAGAKDATQEKIVRMRLFSRLQNILNKGALSDDDAERINSAISTLREAGKTETQILDELGGFSTDIITPYNNAFRDLVVANSDTVQKQDQAMSQVSTLLNKKDYKGAMTAVENLAMTRAKTLDPDSYMGTATASTYLKNIERIRELFGKAGIGYIEGNFENALKRLKGKEATEIKAELTNLYAQFRKENLGSAVTPSEEKFLEPLMAALGDKKGNFSAKLDAFERGLLSRYNATRSSVGLPEVNTAQVILPNTRLNLYMDHSSSGILGGEEETLDI